MRGALLATASAALLLLGAPPFDAAPVALLALVPLLCAVRRAAGVGAAAVLGWVTGVVFLAGLQLWLPGTIARIQSLPWAPALALFLAYIAFQAMQFALFAVGARLGCTPRGRVIAATACWVLIEVAFPQPLPWSLGAALGPHPLLRQGADLAGVRGLAALVVAINALLATAADDWRLHRSGAGAALAGAAVIVIAATGYGRWSLAHSPRDNGATWRIALVQAGGVGERGRAPMEGAAADWGEYARLSTAIAPPVDAILWPESVLPVYLRAAKSWQARVEHLTRQLRATLMLGALDRAADGAELSAAYVFSPRLSAIAYKAILVPFGEYAPPLVRQWNPPLPRRPGPQPPVVDAGVPVAPSVCFEAILPGHFNAAARAGAEVLVNLSDDGWFASPWAAAQHLAMTRLRAVETRRWLVRASHSGISAVIDDRGAIVAALPYGERGTIVWTVGRSAVLTPYARWGDAPLLVICGAGIPMVLARRIRTLCAGRRSAPPATSSRAKRDAF